MKRQDWNLLKNVCTGLKNGVLFGDEKKFNGPNEWNYYYRDLRKDTKFLSRHHMVGEGITIWAGIDYHGRTDVKFI